MGGCAHSESFANATARCAAHGVRLCMRSELHLAKGTGCGEDALYVWVQDTCINASDNSTGTIAALGANPHVAQCESDLEGTRRAVRCCADDVRPPW